MFQKKIDNMENVYFFLELPKQYGMTAILHLCVC